MTHNGDTPAWPDGWAAIYDAIDMDRRPFVAFYTSLVNPAMRSYLDLGCGTGSITLQIATHLPQGARVVGVDLSPKMVAISQTRAPQHEWAVGDICAPPVHGKFDLITVCFNTLQLVLDEADLLRCFHAVAAHLAPGGLFAFDIAQPNPEWLAKVTDEPAVTRRATDSAGRKLEVIERGGHYDPESRVLSGAWTLHDAETGAQLPLDPIIQRLRQYFPDDITRLLAAAGLRLETRFGDFDRQAFKPGTRRQVCLCRLA